MRKPRSQAYNRDVSIRKALRIAREVYYDGDTHPYYSKNKIHCSCSMCSAKTRNKGKRRNLHGNYSPSLNYRISELRKQRSMDADEWDYFFS